MCQEPCLHWEMYEGTKAALIYQEPYCQFFYTQNVHIITIFKKRKRKRKRKSATLISTHLLEGAN